MHNHFRDRLALAVRQCPSLIVQRIHVTPVQSGAHHTEHICGVNHVVVVLIVCHMLGVVTQEWHTIGVGALATKFVKERHVRALARID